MKVLHISTSNKGGAGIAATRLHKKLLAKGFQSTLLTLYKVGSEKIPFHYTLPGEHRILRKVKKLFKPLGMFMSPAEKAEFFLKNRPEGFEYFSFPFSNKDLINHPLVHEHDIIHLHWVSDGILNYRSFFKNNKKKIVWTLHDMNPFTGGCHHADDCEGFLRNCYQCPQLFNTINENYAGEILEMKIKALQSIQDQQLIITTPSSWMKSKSSSSKLFARFRHYVIPNIYDEEVYSPINKKEARRQLSLPEDKVILLFVSHDVTNLRKGINYLLRALEVADTKDVVLCTIGSSALTNSNFEIINLGYVEDETQISKVYSAADLFVLPSLAENYPNSIAESQLCGTPTLAFAVGGIPEQIDPQAGLTVPLRDTDQLSKAIASVIKGEIAFEKEKVRDSALTRFSSDQTVDSYLKIYNNILG